MSSLFLINALVAAIFGLSLTLIPKITTVMYGLTLTDGGLIVTQLLGAALIGFAVLTWLVRNEGESSSRKAILSCLLVSDTIGFVVALIGQIKGVANILGWLNVVIYLMLALGFWYYRFARS